MTVLDHMKAAGYDPNAARNADDLRRMGAGTMECESMYDATLFDLWLAVSLERRRALQIFRFSEFDNWMSQWLV